MPEVTSLDIVFMGTPDFAVPALEAIHHSHHHIQLVVTLPDKPHGRGQRLRGSAVKQKAQELSLPISQPASLKAQAFVDQITELKPDVIVVVAFRILPESIFSIPRLGTFNLHASLLPKYRGAAPIHWALLNGDHETGVTTFFLQKTVDTGNIIQQRVMPISPDDNLGTLYHALCSLGSETVVQTLDLLASGQVDVSSQDDSQASPAPKVSATDQRIDFKESAMQCANRIRAFAPKPGAFCERDGQRLKILKSVPLEQDGRIGEVTELANDHFIVGCGTGSLAIYALQPESKKAMDAAAYLRGYPLSLGITLG
jgi:methionyl-tRNA formyltransferase